MNRKKKAGRASNNKLTLIFPIADDVCFSRQSQHKWLEKCDVKMAVTNEAKCSQSILLYHGEEINIGATQVSCHKQQCTYDRCQGTVNNC